MDFNKILQQENLLLNNDKFKNIAERKNSCVLIEKLQSKLVNNENDVIEYNHRIESLESLIKDKDIVSYIYMV